MAAVSAAEFSEWQAEYLLEPWDAPERIGAAHIRQLTERAAQEPAAAVQATSAPSSPPESPSSPAGVTEADVAQRMATQMKVRGLMDQLREPQ